MHDLIIVNQENLNFWSALIDANFKFNNKNFDSGISKKLIMILLKDIKVHDIERFFKLLL